MTSERGEKASSGRAFFAYFLCTSKESMSPTGETATFKPPRNARHYGVLKDIDVSEPSKVSPM
jgi:hypothetical protein